MKQRHTVDVDWPKGAFWVWDVVTVRKLSRNQFEMIWTCGWWITGLEAVVRRCVHCGNNGMTWSARNYPPAAWITDTREANSDPTIQVLQQKSRLITPGSVICSLSFPLMTLVVTSASLSCCFLPISSNQSGHSPLTSVITQRTATWWIFSLFPFFVNPRVSGFWATQTILFGTSSHGAKYHGY